MIWLILLALLMLGTLGALFAGLVVMSRGGESNKKHGNVLMRWRVLLQFAALSVLAIIMFSSISLSMRWKAMIIDAHGPHPFVIMARVKHALKDMGRSAESADVRRKILLATTRRIAASPKKLQVA